MRNHSATPIIHRQALGAAVLALASVAGCTPKAADSQVDAEPEPSAADQGLPAQTTPELDLGPGDGTYRPLAAARARGPRVDNREAPVPIQCYTKTAGISNPCWTCHTASVYPNLRDDWDLQEEYSFSQYGTKNHWDNAFADRIAAITAITDAEALAYVRQDNYTRLRETLAGKMPPWAYGFDLDVHAGFDDEGFARDGSGWRAFRYKPFPGTFWPTNGSTDDVMIRLGEAFRQVDGQSSTAVYKANLALLEASMASDPAIADTDVRWPAEPLDERELGVDLNGNRQLEREITMIVGLPKAYLGDAAKFPLVRGTYPIDTEFLHSVRYVDPDVPNLLARRMKELRYMHKEHELPRAFYFSQYEAELADKEKGLLPRFGGNAETGLLNPFGWRLQGYIEDGQGELRLQTYEEHLFCMGCHSSLGVTADSTFGFPRKVPGATGWAHQAIDDIPDVPQLGHDAPEVLTYFMRVQGGDELRSNEEILERFFADGELDEAEVRRAAPGGDETLPFLVAPSRTRAILLDKAYMALVREQAFDKGRDALVGVPQNLHREIDNGSTELGKAGRVFRDGTVRLDWTQTKFWPRNG